VRFSELIFFLKTRGEVVEKEGIACVTKQNQTRSSGYADILSLFLSASKLQSFHAESLRDALRLL